MCQSTHASSQLLWLSPACLFYAMQSKSILAVAKSLFSLPYTQNILIWSVCRILNQIQSMFILQSFSLGFLEVFSSDPIPYEIYCHKLTCLPFLCGPLSNMLLTFCCWMLVKYLSSSENFYTVSKYHIIHKGWELVT